MNRCSFSPGYSAKSTWDIGLWKRIDTVFYKSLLGFLILNFMKHFYALSKEVIWVRSSSLQWFCCNLKKKKKKISLENQNKQGLQDHTNKTNARSLARGIGTFRVKGISDMHVHKISIYWYTGTSSIYAYLLILEKKKKKVLLGYWPTKFFDRWKSELGPSESVSGCILW